MIDKDYLVASQPNQSKPPIMKGHHFAWSLVVAGIYLKLLAFALIFCLPLLIHYRTGWNGNAIHLLMGVWSLDFLGRCLCLVAPIPKRRLLVGSIVVQGLAIAASYWVPTVPLEDSSSFIPRYSFSPQQVLTGLLFTIFYAQAIAAILFTYFLAQVSEELQRPDLVSRLKRLRGRVGLTSVAGTFFFPLLVCLGLAIVVPLITAAYLWILWLPVAVVLLLMSIPVLWLIALPLLLMWIDYTIALREIQKAILNVDAHPIGDC